MAGLRTGLVHRPIQGEVVSGDAYGIFDEGAYVLVVVVDGLGHGPEASIASRAAVALVAENRHKPVETLLKDCHVALKPTRGAVMGLARIDRGEQTLTFAGVGNIEARVIGADLVRRPVSVNGIIGYNARKFSAQVVPFHRGDMLLMHSDGLSDRFVLTVEAREADPQMLTFQLAAAHGRPNDDQLVLIVVDDPCET